MRSSEVCGGETVPGIPGAHAQSAILLGLLSGMRIFFPGVRYFTFGNIDGLAQDCGLVQDCSNFIANALELTQSCPKPSVYLISGKMITLFDEIVFCDYHQTSNIRSTFVGNKFVDHSDVVGASAVGASPTTSSFSAWHVA